MKKIILILFLMSSVLSAEAVSDRKHRVEIDDKVYYLTNHQYYAEFLLIPCWLANIKCDKQECQRIKFRISNGGKK